MSFSHTFFGWYFCNSFTHFTQNALGTSSHHNLETRMRLLSSSPSHSLSRRRQYLLQKRVLLLLQKCRQRDWVGAGNKKWEARKASKWMLKAFGASAGQCQQNLLLWRVKSGREKYYIIFFSFWKTKCKDNFVLENAIKYVYRLRGWGEVSRLYMWHNMDTEQINFLELFFYSTLNNSTLSSLASFYLEVVTMNHFLLLMLFDLSSYPLSSQHKFNFPKELPPAVQFSVLANWKWHIQDNILLFKTTHSQTALFNAFLNVVQTGHSHCKKEDAWMILTVNTVNNQKS